jgi:4-amino-4-deoxy-L-arabinose transferase-like glycosyltransferase
MPRLHSFLAVLLASLVFFPLLGKKDIVTSHEARVAQTARQMAAVGWPWESSARIEVPVVGLVERDGDKRLAPLPREGKMTVNPWLVPVLNGHVRLQKPPLPYWCTAVVFRVLGIGEGWARLVPALIGAAMTLLVANLARMILGRRAVLPAALVWTTTFFVVDEFRKAMADPYLAFFALLAVWAWARRGRWSTTITFYVALALGALAKGPVILVPVIPAIALLSFLLRRRRGGTHWPAHVVGAVLFLAIAMSWPLYVIRHVPRALELWRYESIGEFADNVEKARPWWLYAATSFQLPLPWVPLWIAGWVLPFLPASARGMRDTINSPRNRRRLFAMAWFAVVLAIFSFANVKKNAYLLPVMSAQTLIVADSLALMLAWSRRYRAVRGMPAVLTLAQAAIGMGFGAAMVVLCWRTDLHRLPGTAVAAAALLASVVAALSIRAARREAAARWLGVQSIAYALGIVAFVGFYQPDRENDRSPRPFARAVHRYVVESGVPLWRDQLPEEASFYLPLDVPTTDESDVNASSRAIVLVDDNRRDIDRGKLKPDESFFRAYVGDVRIVAIRRLPLDAAFGRWKAYELTIDRARA